MDIQFSGGKTPWQVGVFVPSVQCPECKKNSAIIQKTEITRQGIGSEKPFRTLQNLKTLQESRPKHYYQVVCGTCPNESARYDYPSFALHEFLGGKTPKTSFTTNSTEFNLIDGRLREIIRTERQTFEDGLSKAVDAGLRDFNIGDIRAQKAAQEIDEVNHPPHYTNHPSGVECITITEHMNFNLGNAFKYIWRAGLKSPDAIKDLEKAEFYVKREIKRLKEKSKKLGNYD